MRVIRTSIVVALALSTLFLTVPAQASPGNGWGWGQLPLDTATSVEADGIRASLLAAIPAGVTKARQDALAPLVKAGGLPQDQANLIASVHNASVIAALRARGEISGVTAVAVRKALAGTNGKPAKAAAASIALDRLVSAGLVSDEEAAQIRAAAGLG
jgi:hypothetical protein